MRTKLFLFTAIIILLFQTGWAQFGQSKVQWREHDWRYIQTKHFDIYFNQDGATVAEFAAQTIEDALTSIQGKLNYAINNRISLILYNSQNEFQETNVTDEYLSEGIGGFTELYKNRVVLPFTGDYKMFRHVIHHELVHAVLNDMFYGGSVQNALSNNIQIRIPLWFSEGIAEYLSLGWDSNTDMFIRDAISSEYLPDIPQLDNYFAYRGGQSLFFYIAQKYGEEKIGELVNKIKGKSGVEEGIQAALGLKIEELNERWKKFLKKRYWPDFDDFQDPDEFAKRLTDHRKDGGFYNTSPALSPKGDKIAFISNRDVFFDVYIMSSRDGKILNKIVEGNRSADFEELNILTPGLTWSPDGTKVALGAKSQGSDVIYIIDAESGDKETLPIQLNGIGSVHWSPDGTRLTFSAQNAAQSDIYIYDLQTKELTDLTDDIYTDLDPSWSPDNSMIFFVSDRATMTSADRERSSILKHDIHQNDIYAIRISDKKILRLTNTDLASETSPVCSPDMSELLFISDANGINNIYKLALGKDFAKNFSLDTSAAIMPMTNSMNGIYQLSASNDGKKLAFSSMYQAAYNIFIMNNPFEDHLHKTTLKPSVYTTELHSPPQVNKPAAQMPAESDSLSSGDLNFFTGQYIDSTNTKRDTGAIDYSSYIFGESNYYKITKAKDSLKFTPVNNLDSAGNYIVNKYKVSFSPDIIYANAGFSSLYGLLGTTVLSFSDILGNHRLIAQTSLQIDLKNSDYGLAYFYLPQRTDLGIQGYHMARFVYLDRGGYLNLYRFRNYGAQISASYPFNRFYRMDFGLAYMNLTAENLDNPEDNFDKVTYVLPSADFVHDNTIFGYTAPIEGTRYRFDVLANPFVKTSKYGFYSVMADYRKYFRFFYDYSFAIRFSGGLSRGKNPQKFFIGGTENWINRRFATTDVPLTSASDFAFLTPVLPMRGYDYAEQIGNTFALTNLELRFPLIRYLVTGALPFLFRDVIGVGFIDAGGAWDDKNVRMFEKTADKGVVTKDLLLGTGVGARIYLLYFLLKFDVAWKYDMDSFSKPVFYFSLGADF